MANPDLLHLTVFAQVARLGSMSRAATHLRLAQPTVSARISELEADLQVTLFTRTSRGTDLTPAGRRFLAYSERMLALYSEGANQARSEHERPQLRLAAPASLAETLFARLAQNLARAGYDISLSNDHSPQIIEMLLDGRVDVGFCATRPTPDALTGVPLPAIRIRCIARADHPLATAQPQSYGLTEVARDGLAVFEWAGSVEDLRERLRISLGQTTLHGFVKVSPAEVARQLLLDGEAACFLPELTVARELEAGELVILSPRDLPHYQWDVMLVHRSSDSNNQALADVLGAVRK